MYRPLPTHATGFTVIELMVTMLVAAVLTAIAIPGFQTFVMNDRDANQINSLALSFSYARSEAVKRNTSVGVAVCPSSNSTACNNPAGGWVAGWIVLDMDPTDLAPYNVLQAVPALSGPNVLTETGGGTNGVITFKSSGAVVASAKIKICDIRGSAYARDVEVNAIGTVTSSQTAGKDASGNALTCP